MWQEYYIRFPVDETTLIAFTFLLIIQIFFYQFREGVFKGRVIKDLHTVRRILKFIILLSSSQVHSHQSMVWLDVSNWEDGVNYVDEKWYFVT